MIEHETIDRLARLETKMDSVLETVKEVKSNQEICPARTDYLANRHVLAKRDLSRSRIYSTTGWILAIVAGLSQFGKEIVSWLRS